MVAAPIALGHWRVKFGFLGLVTDLGQEILIAHVVSLGVVALATMSSQLDYHMVTEVTTPCASSQTPHTAQQYRSHAWLVAPSPHISTARAPTPAVARAFQSAPTESATNWRNSAKTP